jgi:hypothetical protein
VKVKSSEIYINYLQVAIEYNRYRNLASRDIYREFNMFEVKVPIEFFLTGGFLAYRNTY